MVQARKVKRIAAAVLVVAAHQGGGKVSIKRIAKHLTMTEWQVRKTFTREILDAIEKSIKASEAAHTGKIHFVVEGALDCTPLFKQQSAHERALDVFSRLRIWDTEHNNGLLVYLLLADHAVEIVADRGIHSRVGASEWQKICRRMKADFKHANYKDGAIKGIDAMTQLLEKHFPATEAANNDFPNKTMRFYRQ